MHGNRPELDVLSPTGPFFLQRNRQRALTEQSSIFFAGIMNTDRFIALENRTTRNLFRRTLPGLPTIS